MKGFKTHNAYQDFTLPTIDGEHFHILGGSW
jgi:surfactin synthase thioesterase subunit